MPAIGGGGTVTSGKGLVFFLALATLGACAGMTGAYSLPSAPGRSGEKLSPWVPGEAIVVFREMQGEGLLNSLISGGGTARRFTSLSLARGKTMVHIRQPGKTTEDILAELLNDPSVESASPNYILRASETVPDDPNFPLQWGLSNTGRFEGTTGADIDALRAWEIRSSSLPGKVVALLDTGISREHPDLQGNIWTDGNGNTGYDFINGDGDPDDDNGHGTHVAGIIGASGNNGTGVAGVAWQAKIAALKILGADGTGTSAHEIAAYEWVLRKKEEGVDIVAVNASFCSSGFSAAARDAIAALGERGVILVAAAGNTSSDNDSTPIYPASYPLPNIISVAATDNRDQLASFSSCGRTSVHLAAPGTLVLSTSMAYSPAPGDILFDDGENGGGAWLASGGWALSGEKSFSPTRSWKMPLEASEVTGISSFLTLGKDLDLSDTSDEPLMFSLKLSADMEEGEELAMDFSADGGASWTTVRSFTEGSGIWSDVSQPVPKEFRTGKFRLRLAFSRSGTTRTSAGKGIFVDDMGIGTASGSYAYKSGTSMAAPFVTGAVALAASQFPDETAGELRSRILSGTDPLPSLQDKVITGGRLNLYGALLADGDTPLDGAIPRSASPEPVSGEEPGGGGGCSSPGGTSAALLLGLPLLLLKRK